MSSEERNMHLQRPIVCLSLFLMVGNTIKNQPIKALVREQLANPASCRSTVRAGFVADPRSRLKNETKTKISTETAPSHGSEVNVSKLRSTALQVSHERALSSAGGPRPVRRQLSKAAKLVGGGGNVVLAATQTLASNKFREFALPFKGRAELFDKIEQEFGVLLERTEAPQAYRACSTIFEALARSQEGQAASHALSVNEFFILDTPIENAFIVPDKSKGVGSIHNIAFVTTGLLKQMTDEGQSIDKGLLRIAGILAHELAHPLDTIDDDGLKHNWGKWSSQAQEVRADAEGTILLRETGYPVDALYQALGRMLESSKRKDEPASAALSTHPPLELRLCALRLLMTLDRYESGTAKLEMPPLDTTGLKEELDVLQKRRGRLTFQEPASIQETTKTTECHQRL